MFTCCFVYIICYADRYYDNSITAMTLKIAHNFCYLFLVLIKKHPPMRMNHRWMNI